MKEYLDNEGVCFGVDCIRSYAAIKKLTQASVQTCEQLIQIVRSRIKAEEVHSASLFSISQLPLSYTSGSLQDCMEQLQSDTKHKSNQHQILADSLKEEVLRPISRLKEQMSNREIALFNQYANMNDALKKLEDDYKKKSASYERAYVQAMSNMSVCRKHAISNEEYKQLTQSVPESSFQTNSGLATTWNSLANLTSSTSLLATKEKGKDWLNWAVASAAGTPTGKFLSPSSNAVVTPVDKKSICIAAMKALDKLEKRRIEARKAWLNYVVLSQRYAIKTQILLTKLQGMQESFILILQDHLRKIVVVESSFLANQQYDIQMLFKVMEDIDVREDMRQFILKNADTPIDLYESDEELEDEDGGTSELMDRNMSTSNDAEDVEVEVVVDQDGKPSMRSKEEISDVERKSKIWKDSPWTSDILFSPKLSHIKELPLPPCGDTMSYSYLRNALVEIHLDELDQSTPSPLLNHQYLSVERARKLSQLSLVSRHIDRHNILIGEGQLGSSLIKLDMLSSTSKKLSSNAITSSTPNVSSNIDDLLSHPLISSDTFVETPQRQSEDQSPLAGEDGAASEDDDGQLMSYGTAEEALAKMIILQKKMRCFWEKLINEFDERNNETSYSHNDISVSGPSSYIADPVERNEEKSSNSSNSSSPAPNENERSDNSNPTSEIEIDEGNSRLSQEEDEFDVLNRSLRDGENDKDGNRAKCLEIMNSFGLLDAVSINIENDLNASGPGQKNPLVAFSFDPSLDAQTSPLSVHDLSISTPLSKNALHTTNLSSTSSTIDDSSDSPMLIGTEKYSKKYFTNAKPESLDFLST